ncbi:MAG: type II toxin-antitoxin system VapC family toxin [Campylobacterales bacterium]|nr:type II toxin-antitoxin system VapC family toxin [Campylobacterales bacterium]
MERSNIFLDANVIIDLIVPFRPQHEAASVLLKYLINNNYQIVISEDMFSTVFYVVKEKKQVLNFFKTIQSKWHIVPFGAEVIKNAIDLSLEKNLDLEDVLQCLCAKENGCSALITNDKKFVDCGVAIYTTDEFLSKSSI